MTYFEDLSTYTFSHEEGQPLRAANVGWLDATHPFLKQVPDHGLLDNLWEYCSIIVLATRGLHSCELCGEPASVFSRHGRNLLLGSGEIRVFGLDAKVFAAPNLIFHYVRDHQYRPPPEFLHALESGPRPGTPEYVRLLEELRVTWRENGAVSGEPVRFRFVRTENGIEKVEVKKNDAC